MREADRVLTVIPAQKKSVIPIFRVSHCEQRDGANVRGDDWLADGADREGLACQLLATPAVARVVAD
jgi:hypothetical protein